MGLYGILVKYNTKYFVKDFELLGVPNCGKTNIWGKLVVDKG